MKKAIVFVAILMLGAFFLSSSVIAYDDLINNDYGGIQPAGSVSGAADLLYSTAGDMFDADSEKQKLSDDSTDLRVVLKGQYGISDKLTAFILLPIDKWDMGDMGESGIADIWLSAKYAILQDNLLNVRGSLDLPVGDDKKGLGNPGSIGLDVAAATRGSFIDKIGYLGQVGIRYNGEDSDTKWKPGLGIYLDTAAFYDLTDAIGTTVGLQYMNIGDGQADGTDMDDSAVNWLELRVGCGYTLMENMYLHGRVFYDITGKNTNADIGIFLGLVYRFIEPN